MPFWSALREIRKRHCWLTFPVHSYYALLLLLFVIVIVVIIIIIYFLQLYGLFRWCLREVLLQGWKFCPSVYPPNVERLREVVIFLWELVPSLLMHCPSQNSEQQQHSIILLSILVLPPDERNAGVLPPFKASIPQEGQTSYLTCFVFPATKAVVLYLNIFCIFLCIFTLENIISSK